MANDDEDAAPAEGRPPRFIYECVRCGHSCADRNYVELTVRDLRRWTEDQTIAAIFQHIRLAPLGKPFLDPVLASDEGLEQLRKGDAGNKGCPLYDRENRLCNIHATMPLSCQAFPLAYDGETFYVRDRECRGLGHGGMTADGLKAHRDAARAEHEARVETAMLMPVLQGLFTRFFVEESARVLDKVPEDDRRTIEDILTKPRGTAAEGDGDGDGGGGGVDGDGGSDGTAEGKQDAGRPDG
jgi:Fe-S-cluster containining protein